MKTLKIFPKTFLYTFALMLFITALAFGLTYLFAIQRAADELPLYFTMSDGTTREISRQLKQEAVAKVIAGAFPLSLLCCGFVSLICSILYSKAFSIPIKRISSATEKMARLEKTAVSDIYSRDEIGILSENINELYQSLLLTIENLEAEKEKVREAERSKVDFLRTASHELKTPVTAVNAMLENMILGVGKYNNHDEYLPKCKELTDQLHVMIMEILDTSKIGMVAEEEETAKTDIADIMDDLCSSYRWFCPHKSVAFGHEKV
jgi:signal transduction histidine kinase